VLSVFAQCIKCFSLFQFLFSHFFYMQTLLLRNRLSRWLATVLLALLSTSAALAQSTANYAFSTSSTGSLVDMSGGTTSVLSASTYHDDDASSVQNIGFTFVFMGVPYTQFSVNSNGQLQFGASAISGTQALPSATTAIIAPLGGDNAIQAAGKVHYKVLPGANRTLVIEWNSLRIPFSSTAATGSLVQAVLEENTGKIEFRYGSVYNNSTSISRSIFIAAGTAAGKIGVVTTFTTSPTYDATATSATTTALPDNAVVPVLNSTADGARTVFTFTPTATAVAPTVSLTAVTQTSLTVNITDNSTNEYSFSVYRSTDNVVFTLLGTVATTSTSGTGGAVTFAQSNLTPGTTYYYRSGALTEGTQTFSSTVSATTLPAVPICGTKSVGPAAGADYATLTAAFSAIAINGVCGPLVLELQSAYVSTTETFPLVYPNAAGTSATNTVTIRPAAGATGLSISSAASTTLNVNGGRYLILDGRPGGSGSTVSGAAQATDLIIANTSTSGVPLQFAGDASFNTVQHCQVKGVGTSLSSNPDILFSSIASVSGNSDNLIRFNNIGDGASLPYSLLYSASSLNARNTITDNNLFNYYGAGANTAAALYLSSAGNNWVVTNNSVYQTGNRAAVGATHYGLYLAAGNGHTVTGNFIGGSAPLAGGTPHTTTGTTSAYRFVGILLSTSGTASSVQGNTIANIAWTSSSGATTGNGILAGIYVSAGDANIGTTTGNVVGTVAGPITVSSSTAAGYTFGISTISTGTVAIAKNVISNITASGSTATIASNVAGINLGGGSVNNVSQNKIYGLVASSGGASLSNGILVTAGTTNNIFNNLMGNLTAPASTSLAALSGIQITAASGVNTVSYNTIRLEGASTGATFGSQGVYLNTTAASLTLFDNIVVNLSTSAGTGGVATAIRRISGTAGTIPNNLFGNNNLYYAGTPSATNLIYTEGTTTQTNAIQTLAAYKTFLVNRETNSVTETATPFASTNGADTNYLHLTPGAATQAESAGQPVSGITTDYDGDTRNASTPDLGADEGSFLVSDLTGPTIVVGTLSSQANTTSRTLTATITDASGVATGASAPRLYFRKGNSGAYVAAAAPTVTGSTYTFTFDYSLVGGVVAGDVINYYLAAQDVLGNLSTNPTGGTGTTPPGTTAPAVAYGFTILPTLSGTYYVSANSATSPVPGRTYATLTAAVAAYNTSGLGGAVTFLLLDPTYSTAETFPIAILNNADASATNTLTIKPSNATGTTSFAITGSNATAVLQLLASDYVTIDGSLGNTISATDLRPSRDLTITNTNTGTSSIVIQQFAQFTSDGATFNTIKNLTAVGTATTAVTGTLYGIQLQSPSNATTPNQYTNNTVQNCAVRNAQIGIGSIGGGVALKTQNTVITQNDLNASGTGALTRNGIFVLFDNNGQVTQNNVANIVNASGSFKTSGILMGFGIAGFSNSTFTGSEVTNALVSRNNISNIGNTGTYSAVGIGVASAASGTNTVANNFVSGVISNGTLGDFGAGIFANGFAGGGTTRVLYNSVSMTGTTTGASQPSFALAIGGSSPAIEVRNNVLYNAQSVGSSSFAVGFAYPGTPGNYAGLTSSNNAFLGTNGIGLTGSLASGTTRNTLADLFTETGQDRPAAVPGGSSLTLSGSPFVSVTDLHVSTTSPSGLALNGAGTPIAGITTDFDNETRNATTPDIGADEFLTNLDVAAVALVSPVAANQCFTNAETVTVSIRNASTTTALNFATNPVTVTVNITGPTPALLTQVVNTGTLAAGATQNVTFTTTADFSAVGTYSVTVSTTLAGDDNNANNNLAPIAITTAPARLATFTLPSTTLCAGSTATLTPTLGAGATAGTFSASPTGLTLNATTGVVSAAGSTPGTYTVTNTLPAGNGCTAVTATQTVVVAPQTTATFSYASASYCTSGTNPTPTITGTAGGAFTSTAGLSINGTTGVINLSASSAGTYIVTYAVSGTCSSSATQTVVITLPQTAAFTYAAGTNCAGATGTVAATLATGATAGTFSATPAGLGLNASTGAINLATSAAGTYIVVNSLPAANGCAAVSSNATITLSPTPSAAFNYSAGTFCLSGTNPTPSITGAAGGTFSATPAGLSLNAGTGAINLAASTAGTYSVTYAVAANCPASTTVSVTITNAPSAAFTYAAGGNCAGSAGTLAPSFGTGASAGTFTATPAGLTINAATGVVALSTSTAGTYTITNSIAAASGCAAATASQTLTINAAPVATLTAGGPTTFCAGGSVVLTATAGTGNTYQFFNGATSLGAASATNTLTVTASGTYTVVVTNAATCQATSAATTVTVNPLTTATFTYAGSPFCQSGTNPTPAITGTAGGAFSSTSGLSINATTGVINLGASTPGTYTVTYAVSGSCPSSATQTVVITAPATAAFSYPTAGTCAGAVGTLTPTLGTGATAGTFSLPTATGLSINATTGVVTVSATAAAGTYTVTNTVAAANGCAAVTSTATLVVNPAAVANAGPAVTTCSNVAATLGSAPVAGTTYAWTPTTGLSSATVSNPTVTLTNTTSAPITTTYTLTATTASGCVATASVTVTVNPAAVATFSYGAPASFCTSQTTAQAVTLGTGATAGVFSSTTGLTLNATTGAITPSTSTPGTYTVTNTVAAAGGCAAVTATTQVTITAPQTATFSYANASACAGSTALLTPTMGTGATAGVFSSTTGLTLNATTGAVNPATSTAGTYTVTNTVAASGGCAAVTSTATVTINALPATPTYTYVYPTRSTVTFTSSVAPAGTTYQWYLTVGANTSPITGATSQTYTANGVTAPGAYTVRFINSTTGCQSAPSTALAVTATAQPLAGSSLTLFPNPTADGKVTLQLSGYPKAVQLTVIDALGRVVLTQKVAAGQSQTQLDLSGTATGVYLLRATTEGGTDVRRIVRQ
jgi:hypothetical protein